VHPRTVRKLEAGKIFLRIKSAPNLKIVEPLGYLEFVCLMAGAGVVITDSGGIQEETTFLGIPCLTLRENTERPITIIQGTNELAALENLEKKIDLILSGKWKKGKIPKYWDGKTAGRIADVLQRI